MRCVGEKTEKNLENTPVRGKADRNSLVAIRFQHGIQHHRCALGAVQHRRKFRFAGNPVKNGESVRRGGEKTGKTSGKHARSGEKVSVAVVGVRAVQHRRKFRFAGNPVKNGGIHAVRRRENRKNPENTPVRGKRIGTA